MYAGEGNRWQSKCIYSKVEESSTNKMSGKLKRQLDPTQTGLDASKLRADLHKRVVGQDDAIEEVVNIYQTFLAGLSSPGRPIGNFLFLGPTGSGKTRMVEAAAESLMGDMNSVIKIDCAEFQHSHEIAKLVGSPPGYLGHRETHPILSQEVLNQHHTEKFKVSFVLFDEIEKASDALWNLLLGILDKASLTLGDNRRVDFSRSLIFMTSNLGAHEMEAILRPKLGFGSHAGEVRRFDGIVESGDSEKIKRAAVEAARKKFTPEFMNRIDKVLVFHPLGAAELDKILSLELNILQQRIFHSVSAVPFVFQLTFDARHFLLREGTDMKYGARHLKRAIDRRLLHPLSNLVASEQIHAGDLIQVDYTAATGGLSFATEAEDMPAYAMAELSGNPVEALATAAVAASPAVAKQSANAKSSRN
jgi:ATP-dependent Clp protease ATP-binding subunit ClpB